MTEVFTRHYHRRNAIQIDSVTPGSKITKPVKTNKYELQVKYMFGDADGYDTETYYFPKDQEPHMIGFINFVLRCMSAYPSGMGGSDDFTHVEGYNTYVPNYDIDEDDPDAQDEALIVMEDWPNQEYAGIGAPDTITLFFYDEDGVKRKVEMNEIK